MGLKKLPLIINVRGNSGSGKTHLTREFMKKFGIDVPIWFGNEYKKKRAHAMVDSLHGKFCVIGSYDNACGGCDTIKTQAEVASRVNQAALLGYRVIWLEGLIMSTIYGTVGEFSEQYKDRWVFAFLDTPIELCMARIKLRRIKAGNTKPLNELNTRNRVKTIERNREIVAGHGRRVVVLPHQSPLKPLLEIIRKEV